MCRVEVIAPSEDMQKWVHTIWNGIIPVCVKTHVWLSCSNSESCQSGFRELQFSQVRSAVQAIRIVNETEFLSPVNECEHNFRV